MRIFWFCASAFVLGTLNTAHAAVSCQPLHTFNHTNGGVFALASFKNKLYVGLFGYGNSANKSMLYQYNAATNAMTAIPGLSQAKLGYAESVCALKEFKGYLYAATEERGKILRSSDGQNWQEVFDGPYKTACALEVHNGYLYAAIAKTESGAELGKIYRTNSGNSGTWAATQFDQEPGYIREIQAFDGRLYAFSVKSGVGYWSTSGSGQNWSRNKTSDDFGQNVRVFKSTPQGSRLWLGSAKRSATGVNTQLWHLNGGQLTLAHTDNLFSHFTEMASGYVTSTRAPVLISGASAGFKSAPFGTSPALKFSTNNGVSWSNFCPLPDADGIWTITTHGKSVYFGSMTGGSNSGYGRLYRINGVTVARPTNPNTGNPGGGKVSHFLSSILLLLTDDS